MSKEKFTELNLRPSFLRRILINDTKKILSKVHKNIDISDEILANISFDLSKNVKWAMGLDYFKNVDFTKLGLYLQTFNCTVKNDEVHGSNISVDIIKSVYGDLNLDNPYDEYLEHMYYKYATGVFVKLNTIMYDIRLLMIDTFMIPKNDIAYYILEIIVHELIHYARMQLVLNKELSLDEIKSPNEEDYVDKLAKEISKKAIKDNKHIFDDIIKYLNKLFDENYDCLKTLNDIKK
jgi:hypothetical protein